MAKFRLRNLINRSLYLDGLRLSFLAKFCEHGYTFFVRSYAMQKIIAAGARAYASGNKPAIFAIYHQRIAGLPGVLADCRRLSVLISQSRDGEIIARALSALGYAITRGSSKRGAVQGSLQTIEAAAAGLCPVIVVDGPRGPLYEVKPGIIRLAQLTGLPIVPFVFSARSSWLFWGWDKFVGPLWGSPLLCIFGDPIVVPAECTGVEREKYKLQLDRNLTHLRIQADAYWRL